MTCKDVYSLNIECLVLSLTFVFLPPSTGKLESYTKRSLATFKEKYMAVLQTMKVRTLLCVVYCHGIMEVC